MPQGFRDMGEYSDEFARRCQLRYEQFQKGSANDNQIDIERQVAEEMAIEGNYLFSHQSLYSMWSIGPAGDENETFYDGNYVYKMNNLWHCINISSYFKKMLMHNRLFPEMAYSFIGFCGDMGRSMYPISRQRMVKGATPATQKEIDEHMLSLGYDKKDEGRFERDGIVVWDLFPKNVLKAQSGMLYIIDAEFL